MLMFTYFFRNEFSPLLVDSGIISIFKLKRKSFMQIIFHVPRKIFLPSQSLLFLSLALLSTTRKWKRMEKKNKEFIDCCTHKHTRVYHKYLSWEAFLMALYFIFEISVGFDRILVIFIFLAASASFFSSFALANTRFFSRCFFFILIYASCLFPFAHSFCMFVSKSIR